MRYERHELDRNDEKSTGNSAFYESSNKACPKRRHYISRIVLSDAELTPLELTVLTGLSKSAVSRLIEHLERKELLQKKYNSNDKRSYTLLCTVKGTMELEKTYQYYLEPIYRLRKILGDEKFEALIKYIKEANDLMMKNGR